MDLLSINYRSVISEGLIGSLAGFNGGLACVYVSQPMDTIKVKMQTFPDIYKDTKSCIKITWIKYGLIRGFYAGTLPSLSASISENVVIFTVLPFCKRFVSWVVGNSSDKELTCLQTACAGSCGGLFTSLVMCPNELIKCKLQSVREFAENNKKKLISNKVTPTSVIREILKKEGVRGLYRGYTCTIAREIPGMFCYIGGNEVSRYLLTPRGKSKADLNPVSTAIAGGIGGASLWTMVFPLDVVKSRIQVGRTSPSGIIQMKEVQCLQPEFITILFSIIKTEGIRTLYRGLFPTLVRTIPSTATLFLVVEETKKFGYRFLN